MKFINSFKGVCLVVMLLSFVSFVFADGSPNSFSAVIKNNYPQGKSCPGGLNTDVVKWDVKLGKTCQEDGEFTAYCAEGGAITIPAMQSQTVLCVPSVFPQPLEGPHCLRVSWCGSTNFYDYRSDALSAAPVVCDESSLTCVSKCGRVWWPSREVGPLGEYEAVGASSCCGDDLGESAVQIGDVYGCCSIEHDSFNANGECVTQEEDTLDIVDTTSKESCEGNAGDRWLVSGEADPHGSYFDLGRPDTVRGSYFSCCGDDPDESVVEGPGGAVICCRVPSEYPGTVAVNGACYPNAPNDLKDVCLALGFKWLKSGTGVDFRPYSTVEYSYGDTSSWSCCGDGTQEVVISDPDSPGGSVCCPSDKEGGCGGNPGEEATVDEASCEAAYYGWVRSGEVYSFGSFGAYDSFSCCGDGGYTFNEFVVGDRCCDSYYDYVLNGYCYSGGDDTGVNVQAFCEANGHKWITSGEVDLFGSYKDAYPSCCGDNSGEYVVEGGGVSLCCNEASDYVAKDGEEVNRCYPRKDDVSPESEDNPVVPAPDNRIPILSDIWDFVDNMVRNLF